MTTPEGWKQSESPRRRFSHTALYDDVFRRRRGGKFRWSRRYNMSRRKGRGPCLCKHLVGDFFNVALTMIDRRTDLLCLCPKYKSSSLHPPTATMLSSIVHFGIETLRLQRWNAGGYCFIRCLSAILRQARPELSMRIFWRKALKLFNNLMRSTDILSFRFCFTASV